MKKRVLSVAMICIVAVVSFYIGTTVSGLKAAPPLVSPTPMSQQWIGVAEANGSIYAVYEQNGNLYGQRVRTQ